MRTRRPLPLKILRLNPIGLSAAEVVDLSSFTGGTPTKPRPTDARMREAVRAALDELRTSKFYSPQPGVALYPYQAAALAFINEAGARSTAALNGRPSWRLGVFDPPGVGKTLIGASASVLMAARLTVVVRPNSASRAWPKAFNQIADGKHVHVDLDTSVGEDNMRTFLKKLREVLDGGVPVVLTMNYTSVIVGTPLILEEFPHIDMTIFDEAHNIRNPDAQKTVAARSLMEASQFVLLLTGTPALSSALESLQMLAFLEQTGGRWSPFAGSADYQTAQDRFLRAQQDPGFTVRAGLMDIAYPRSASALTRRIKSVGVRRTRSSIRDEQAAPPDQLQPIKTRMIEWIAPDPQYDGVAQPLARTLMAKQGLGSFQRVLAEKQALEADITRAIRNVDADVRDPQQHVTWPVRQLPNGKFTGWKAAASMVLDVERPRTRVTTALSMPTNLKNLEEAARRARSSIPVGVIAEMTRLNLQAAVNVPARAKYSGRNGVFMLRLINSACRMALALSRRYPHARVYLKVGSNPDVTDLDADDELQTIAPVNRITYFQDGRKVNDGRGELDFTDIELEFAKKDGIQRFLVATQVANAGLSLPTADFLVMVERLFSPGEEEQAEDRINRAGKLQGRPGAFNDIIYTVPDEVFGAALGHRMENRRLSLLSLYGEKPASDNATSLADAFRTRMAGRASSNVTAAQVFDVVDIVEDPREYAIAMIVERLKRMPLTGVKGTPAVP